jgi:hypothetical protein
MRWFVLSLVGIVASSAAAQPCSPYWSDSGPGICLSPLYSNQLRIFENTPFVITCNQVRRWNGTDWAPANDGMFGTPQGLWSFDEGAGHRLHTWAVVGNDVSLLRWNGSTWEPSTPGLFLRQSSQIWTQPFVSVAGAGGPTTYGLRRYGFDTWVTRWSGSAWQDIGALDDWLFDVLLDFDDGSGPALYIVGARYINGIPAGGFARWNGQSWTPLLADNDRIAKMRQPIGGIINGQPAIYIIGRRITNQQALPLSVYRVTTQGQITDIGLPVWYTEPQIMMEYWTLHIFDMGEGPNLFLGGGFAYDTSAPIRRGNIGRWDGTQWHRMGVGLNGTVFHIAGMHVGDTPVLFASGYVQAIGQGQVTGVAAWTGCPNCYANCDGSGVSPALNVEDFMCYIRRLAELDPYADCDLNGMFNVDDFTCFVGRFVEGMLGGAACP